MVCLSPKEDDLSSFDGVILVLANAAKQRRVIADATITHYHPGSITSSITPAVGIYTATTPDPVRDGAPQPSLAPALQQASAWRDCRASLSSVESWSSDLAQRD